jgi:predicted SAM-dependent methyltransferase
MVAYYSETEKIKDRVSKYLSGVVLDIGSDLHFYKVSEDALGVGIKAKSYMVCDEMPELKQKVDVIFSSHILQNYSNDDEMVLDWSKMLKIGGLLILYLPDDRAYDHGQNTSAKQRYKFEDFISWLGNKFPFMKVIDSGLDIGKDKYSFFIVAKKMGEGLIFKEKPWLSWEEKELFSYNRISTDDFVTLRALYESTMSERIKFSIKSAVEEIIYLRKKYEDK